MPNNNFEETGMTSVKSNINNNVETIETQQEHFKNGNKKGFLGYVRWRIQQIMQPGITLKQRVRFTPGIGYVIAFTIALIKLPSIRLQVAKHEGILDAYLLQLENLRLQSERTNERIDVLAASLEKITVRLDRNDALDIGKRLMEFDQLQIARNFKSIQRMMKDQKVREDKLNSLFVDSQNNIPNMGSTNLALKSNISEEKENLESRKVSNSHSLTQEKVLQEDTFYTEFEALFRGERADIKDRLTVYLPLLANIPLTEDNEKRLVIDIGCGRGEWLELLDENNIPAMGVDINSKMIDICLEQGLYAKCADAIQILNEQEPGSVGAITGFHIIEHLPFELLKAMFDAALNALCKDGIVIFETPNPENLKVGACNFYFDPTHLNPIVPQVAEFMAKQRGFAHAEIMRLHPYPDNFLLKGGSDVEILINKEFFGPQDYAVIGRK